MVHAPKTVVVLPGLNVATTLERTLHAIPKGTASELIFVDDGGNDGGDLLAQKLGCHVVRHDVNRGYGAAQKSGYREALRMGADVVVMVHPDFQYKPELVPAMASMVTHGGYDLVLGSRLLMRGALAGGMPVWKYVANRALTVFENGLMGAGLSEYHTGYRAFSRRLLEQLPLANNRNDFVFDNELIAQALHFKYSIGEISCPANYFDGMQTISFRGGITYGLGCVRTALTMRLHRAGAVPSHLFQESGGTLEEWPHGEMLPTGAGTPDFVRA